MAHQTKLISRGDLIAVLSSLHSLGTSNVQIHTRTDARLLRTGNPFPKGGVLKVSAFNVAMGKNYGAGVRRKLAKAGKPADFQAESNWFQPHNGSNTIVEHRKDASKLYARLPVNTQIKAITAFETPAGEPVAREEIAAFIPKKSASRKQAAAGLAEGEQEVFRTVAIENIVGITYNGETLLVQTD